MPKPSRQNYIPTYPNLFVVDFDDGEFSSCLRAIKCFEAGEFMAPLEPSRLKRGPKAYTSVQCGPGPNDHLELNSDLVYTNHSCDPNAAFDLSSPDPSKWHLRALKRIEPGQVVTFFYPSTEWDMDQPFSCECKAKTCLGRIRGAKHLSPAQLAARGFINSYILKLVSERDGEASLKFQSRL